MLHLLGYEYHRLVDQHKHPATSPGVGVGARNTVSGDIKAERAALMSLIPNPGSQIMSGLEALPRGQAHAILSTVTQPQPQTLRTLQEEVIGASSVDMRAKGLPRTAANSTAQSLGDSTGNYCCG